MRLDDLRTLLSGGLTKARLRALIEDTEGNRLDRLCEVVGVEAGEDGRTVVLRVRLPEIRGEMPPLAVRRLPTLC